MYIQYTNVWTNVVGFSLFKEFISDRKNVE